MPVVKKPQSTAGSLLELVMIVAVALGLALGIQKFLVKPYRIPSESMVPTLQVGQRVLVNRIGHSFSKPAVGDVVVFHPPQGAESARCGVAHPREQVCPESVPRKDSVNFIKRVVAGPGDRVAVEGGHVILNGKEQKEPFTAPCDPGGGCNFPREITVPAGQYFMMGDNRGSSDDSRYWGPIPDDWIIGGAFATYWPPGRIGLL
jgi:signal peptidase I